MRVLVLSNKCPPDYDGGYELKAFLVAKALRARGYDILFVTSHFRDSYKGDRKDPDWVHRIFEFREWRSLSGSKPARLVKDVKRVAYLTEIGVANGERLDEFLKTHPVDLAYCNGLHGIGLATAFPLAKRGIPTFWHVGNYLIPLDLQLRRLFKRERFAHRVGMHLFARKAMGRIFQGDYRHIAFQSESMRKEFLRLGYEPEHSYFIPRGIDFPFADDLDRVRLNPPVFFMASRVSEEKGYGVVVEAMAKLAAARPELKWEVRVGGSGEPAYIESLQKKARELGVGDRLIFLGMLQRETVLENMRTAIASISATLWIEPFGGTTIEAMASGTPLISSDSGVIFEIVGDSECALIYPKADSGALKDAMERILLSEDLRRDLARRAMARMKEAYSMDRILDMTEDVFEKVMAAHGKPFVRPERPTRASA